MFKICIADDEKWVLESIAQRIKQCKLPVKICGIAQNGLEAYEIYEKVKPDIFFIDISMPICSGLEFVERVRRLDKESSTKFIIISGYDDFEYMKKAIKSGVVNYIMKPIAQKELYETLDEVCRNFEMEREKEWKTGENWKNFKEYSSLQELFSGTVLLIFGEKIAEILRENVAAMEVLINVEGNYDTCEIIYFHECENMLLLAFHGTVLLEQEIYCIWEKLKVFQEIWLVYKSGREFSLPEIMEKMEVTLNTRFWQGTMHVLSAGQGESTLSIDLSNLERAIENIREEEWKKEITGLVTGIFEKKENNVVLDNFYRSVLILIANKYRQHSYEIPENLTEELYPYALERCMTRQEVQKKLYEYTRLIHEKILQDSQKSEMIEQVIEYLEYHYAEDVNFNDVASEFFITPNYLYRRFKEKKNKSVMQYLEEIRMKKAKELLKNTTLSVTEVAARTGYGDSNYFSRIFKKTCGKTPREFRNQ